jgi:hypothetical protein
MFPIRVDVEQGAGRFTLYVQPNRLSIRAGDAVEWDFRYLNGSDARAASVAIEFPTPPPFGQAKFKSEKPGSNRPHRQISGPALPVDGVKEIGYTFRCFDLIGREIAAFSPELVITPA